MHAELRCILGHTFGALGPRPVVVDLGANDGRFAAELLSQYPEAQVVLVEADPLLVGMLRQRFARQGNVQLYAGLVGGQAADRVPFHLSRIPEGNSLHAALAASWADGETRTIEAPMITLAGLLELARLPAVDLVKIDIEGAEYDVLPTLDRALAERLAQLTVEFHDFVEPSWRTRTAACVAHLTALGFAHSARGTSLRAGSAHFDCHFWREGGV
jgi:FkbM family methyltransferase